MNEKIVYLLLVCLMALSLVYVCSGSFLRDPLTQPMEAASSRPSKTIERPCQIGKLFIQENGFRTMGDPIEDPTPNARVPVDLMPNSSKL